MMEINDLDARIAQLAESIGGARADYDELVFIEENSPHDLSHEAADAYERVSDSEAWVEHLDAELRNLKLERTELLGSIESTHKVQNDGQPKTIQTSN